MIGKNAGELIKEENRKNQRGRSNALSMRVPEEGKVQTFNIKSNCVFCDKDYIPDDYEYWTHRTGMKGFIELLKEEENKAKDFPKTNTKKMITFLRKIFYGKESWDEYLITHDEVKSVSGPYGKPKLYIEKQPYIVDPPGPNLKIDRNEICVLTQDNKRPKILVNQTVCMEDGCYVDLGHTLAGLDALNYTHPVIAPIFYKIRIDSNVDAVTWVGDFGSVLAELQFQYINNNFKPLSLMKVHKTLREYAPPWDMLGNIDAYVIGKEFDISTMNGQKVSEIFEKYYLTNHPAKIERYRTFAKQVDLDWDKDTKKFLNETSWVKKYTDQVNDAAALYTAANAMGDLPSFDYIVKGIASASLSLNQGSEWLVKSFLNKLKMCIQKEERNACR